MNFITILLLILFSVLKLSAQTQNPPRPESVSFYYYEDKDNSVRIEKLKVTSSMRLHWFSANVRKSDGHIELLADICTTMIVDGKFEKHEEYFNSGLWAYPDGTIVYFPPFEKLILINSFTLPMYPNGIGGNKLSQNLNQSSMFNGMQIPGLTNCQ